MQKLLLSLILPLVPALGVTEPLREFASVLYPSHMDFPPRCTPLAPDSRVATPPNRLAITRRRALLSGTIDAPRLPQNPCATGIPVKTFIEKVGGEQLDARVMVSPGFNPHTYDPAPQQISALADAVLYVRVDVPFEAAWTARIRSANPGMAVLDARAGIRLREMEAHAHDEHGHEAERQEEPDLDLAHGAEAPQAVITTSTTPHSTQDYPDEATILSPSGRHRSAPRAC